MQKGVLTLMLSSVIFSSTSSAFASDPTMITIVEGDNYSHDLTEAICKDGKIHSKDGTLLTVDDHIGYMSCGFDDETFSNVGQPANGYTKPDMSDQDKDSGLIGDTGIKLEQGDATLSADSLNLWLIHNDSNTVAEFTLEVKNVTKNTTSKYKVTSKDYNKDSLMYKVNIDKFNYSTGDKIHLKVTEWGKFTKQLNMVVGSRVYALTKEKPSAYYSVNTYKIGEGEEANAGTQYIEGTADYPIQGSIELNTSYVLYEIKDKEDKPIPNTPVIFENIKTGDKVTVNTDSNGNAYVPKEIVTDYHKITPEGYDTIEHAPPFIGDTTMESDFIHKEQVQIGEDATLIEAQEEAKNKLKSAENYTKYELQFKFTADTRASSEWLQADITFKENEHKMHVNYEQQFVEIPKGYTIKDITSKYAKVTNYKISGDKLIITLEPKYTIEIWNNGEAYDVTLVGLEPPVTLKGKDKVILGVMPNMTLVVKNNKTDRVTNLRANEKNQNIEMNMKYGITKGGNASSPHTNVWIYVWTIVLILAIVGGLVYWKYLKIIDKKKLAKNSTFLGLITVLVGSSILPYTVSANTNIGGGNGSGNANSSLSANILNYTSDTALIEVYFASPTSVDNSFYGKKGNVATVANAEKYSRTYRSKAVYFAPDMHSYSMANNTGSGVVEFDDTAPINNRFKVLHGKNAMISLLRRIQPSASANLYDPSAGSTSADNFKKRIVHPATAIRGANYTGAGAEFVNAIQQGLRNGSSRTSYYGKSYPLSGAIGNTSAGVSAYGDVVAKYLEDTYSGEEPEKIKKREQLFEGYVQLLVAKGLATRAELASLQEAFYEGKAVMMINTVVGIRASSATASGEHAFMTVNDALKWYKWIGMDYYKGNTTKHNAMSNLSPFKERQMIAKIRENWYLTPDANAKGRFLTNGTIQWTLPQWMYAYYTVTIRPVNANLPSSSNPSQNPFGGWGYMYFGKVKPSNAPRLTVKIEYVEVETNTRVKTVIPQGWSYDDGRLFSSLMKQGYSQTRIPIETSFTAHGELYTIDQESSYSVTTTDIPKEGNACRVTGGEELTKANSPNSGKKFEGILANNLNNNTLNASNYVNFSFLHNYLGGTPIDKVSPTGTSKYSTSDSTGEVQCYADAEMVIRVPIKTRKKKFESDKLVVPQWSLSRYFEDMTVPRANKGAIGKGGVTLYFLFSADGIPKLDVDFGYVARMEDETYMLKLKYEDIVEHYKKGWFVDYPFVINKEGVKADYHQKEFDPSVTTSAPSALTQEAEVKAGIDAVAVKTRKDIKLSGVSVETVDSLQVANWVESNGSLGDGIEFSSPFSEKNTGVRIPTDVLPYKSLVKYDKKNLTVTLDSQLESLFPDYAVYQSGYIYVFDNKGNIVDVTKVESSKKMTLEPLLAKIVGNFEFHKYNPKASKSVNTGSDNVKKSSSYASFLITKDKRKLKLYPEVPMLLEDKGGKSSVFFVVGEQERVVNPHVYEHVFLQIKDGSDKVEVEAGVTGAEATGQNVAGLTSTVKANNQNIVRPVLNKGTTTTNSIQLHNAEIVYEIFNLEYKDEQVKKKWLTANGGTVGKEYDTKNLRDEYKKKLIKSTENGGQVVQGGTDSYYYVGDKQYENVKKDTVFKLRDTEVVEYDLVIRGGYLERVGDYTYTDLKEYFENPEKCDYNTAYAYDEKKTLACAMMRLYIVPVWDDVKQGVYYVLERAVGDKVYENDEGTFKQYVTLANAMRGVASEPALKPVKQEIGKEWYMEDTTAFKLEIERMYFEIPSVLWTAKTPLEYADKTLQTPQDKNLFYTKGSASNIGTTFTWGKDKEGLQLVFNINTALLPYKGESQKTSNIVTRSPYDYVTPNVSVLDALQ